MNARFAFRTLDGLIAVDDCPDVDDTADHIVRPVKPYPPIVNGMRRQFCKVRYYERTGETYLGLPVFQEMEGE